MRLKNMYKIAQYKYGTSYCNDEMLMCEPSMDPNLIRLREYDTGREIQFRRGGCIQIYKLIVDRKSFIRLNLSLEIFVY